MSDVTDVSELTRKPDDVDQRRPLIAWRSLVVSLVIAVVTAVFFIVALIRFEASSHHVPPWLFNSFIWVSINFFVLPICFGGFYLALRVRRNWIVQATIYSAVFLVFPLLLLILLSSSSATHVLVRIALCYPVILLLRLPARRLASRNRFFKTEANENLRFGFVTMFWGSACVALLILLVTRSIDSNRESHKQYELESARDARNRLIELGANYDGAANQLTFKSNTSNFDPYGPDVASLVGRLRKTASVTFIDCEITDETIAYFRQLQPIYEFGNVQFENCIVVKEQSPRVIIRKINVPLGPLSGGLPK